MCFHIFGKLIKKTGKSEQGFVLIVAIMAIVILIAVGFFALTIISGDLMITARLVGERKAFSAAESGVHAILSSSLDPVVGTITEVHVDPTGDPATTYIATTTATDIETPVAGYDPASRSRVFNTLVTGRDSNYGSKAQISIGMAGRPVDSSTIQGKL
ncbi:MAG: hypothetical protein STSR0002_00280 [Smithella sp.]|jgi:hypothetical protein